MSKGISLDVINRLWNLIRQTRRGATKTELTASHPGGERGLAADLARLRRIGLEIDYSRKRDAYHIWWPDESIPYRFDSKEFFYVFYVLKVTRGAPSALSSKLSLPLSPETNPVFDVGPAYGIQRVGEELTPLLDVLKDAIRYDFVIHFIYKSQSSAERIRTVHPYRLVHTPISWYLVGKCEDKGEIRNFKLSRIRHLDLTKRHFKREPFDIAAHLGDAWWIRKNPDRLDDPHLVRVLFKGDAADSIKEYHFHDTQRATDTPAGTEVEWRLSHLGEFASWLMQWLGEIEILEPPELKSLILKRTKSFLRHNSKKHNADSLTVADAQKGITPHA